MTDAERTIRAYLTRSCGNAGHPSVHTLQCFVGMVQTGEADIETFRKVGGEWIVEQMATEAKERGWGAVQCESR